MESSLKSFLNDGMKFYPEALETTDLFEKEILTLLKPACEAAIQNIPVEIYETETKGLTQTLGNADGRTVGFWVWSKDHAKTKNYLEMGLWWPREKPEIVILYIYSRRPIDGYDFHFEENPELPNPKEGRTPSPQLYRQLKNIETIASDLEDTIDAFFKAFRKSSKRKEVG